MRRVLGERLQEGRVGPAQGEGSVSSEAMA